MTAPVNVEQVKLFANSPWDFEDGEAAYQAALLVIQALRQDPALLSRRKRTHADFAKILQLSTPDHRSWLEKRIAALLRAQEDPSARRPSSRTTTSSPTGARGRSSRCTSPTSGW